MHLLVDVDSTIPNLALMRISKWLKRQGKVPSLLQCSSRAVLGMWSERYDAVWISCVFEWHRDLAVSIAHAFDAMAIPVHIGGTGVDRKIKLPSEIESCPPDYDLYGDDRAIGFLQRGCIRKCEFCGVPEKEGHLSQNIYTPLKDWVPEGFNKVCLLDNEFAAIPIDGHERYRLKHRDPPWDFQFTQKEIFERCRANGWQLSITQGYDLRCVDDDRAAMLADYKPKDLKFRVNRLYCAWDYIGIGPQVLKAIGQLTDAGFRPNEIMVYCICGFNKYPERYDKAKDHVQVYYRFQELRELGTLPYVMKYNKRMDDKFLNAFARWVNRGEVSYRSHSFIDYCNYRHPSLVDEAIRVTDIADRAHEDPKLVL